MKKKNNLRRMTVSLLAAAMVLPCLAGVPNAMADSPFPYNINFSFGNNSDTTMNFNWTTSQSVTDAKVQIAKTSDMSGDNFPASSTVATGTVTAMAYTAGVEIDNPPKSKTDAPSGEYGCKVTVTGLVPGTQYTYRAGDGTNWSKNYTFKTYDTSKGFNFVALGDPQIGASGNDANDAAGWANTLSLISQKYTSLNFLFSLGDQVDKQDDLGRVESQYLDFFNPDSTKDYLQSIPFMMLEGNHDHNMGKYYSFHYNQPNLSTLGQSAFQNTSNNDGDYSFTYGNTLFMVLNANDTLDTASHESFLKKAIAANPNVKWKVCAWHQAPYSEANHDGSTEPTDNVMFIRQHWSVLMDEFGIDVVLNGHDHSYTRSFQMLNNAPVSTSVVSSVTNPKGTVYFTLDSASGSKFYPFNNSADHSFSAVFNQPNKPSYSYISITDDSFKISTYTTDSTTPFDTYSITKTSTNPSSSSSSGSSSAGSQISSTTSNPKTGDSVPGSAAYGILFTIAAILMAGAGVTVYTLKKKKA